MKLGMGPTGGIITGHVLDVSKRGLEERLQDYDSQLYVTWNPKKLYGWGCWEVRRRPNKKTVRDVLVYNGNTYVDVDYVENDFENHVLDVPYLNYGVLARIAEMDIFVNFKEGAGFAADLEYQEAKAREKGEQAAAEEQRYMARYYKSAIRDLREAILSGANPHQIAKHWGSISS